MNPASLAGERLDFTYRSAQGIVRFGRGSLTSLPEILATVGLTRPLVICTPGQNALGRRVAALLGEECRGVHAKAIVHVPSDTANTAVAEANRTSAQSLVAVGGGSAIGLAKAVALDSSLPIVAIPTTFAGSEMTPVWGLTANGHKQTGRNPAVRPVAVLYDPALADGLSLRVAVASGINALAHAAEALWAPDRSPVSTLFALEGAGAITNALRQMLDDSHRSGDRDRALYGAWLCGSCLGTTTMGIHHALCHAVGGTLNLPHAETHSVILPVILQRQREREPYAVDVLAAAVGVPSEDLAATIRDLAAEAGLPVTLAEMGMSEGDIGRVSANVHLSPAAQENWTAEEVRDALTVAMRGDS